MQARCAVVGGSSTTARFVTCLVQCCSYSENNMRAARETRMLWLTATEGSPEMLPRDNGRGQSDSESATMTSGVRECGMRHTHSSACVWAASGLPEQHPGEIHDGKKFGSGLRHRQIQEKRARANNARSGGPSHGPAVARCRKQGIERTWGATPPWKQNINCPCFLQSICHTWRADGGIFVDGGIIAGPSTRRMGVHPLPLQRLHAPYNCTTDEENHRGNACNDELAALAQAGGATGFGAAVAGERDGVPSNTAIWHGMVHVLVSHSNGRLPQTYYKLNISTHIPTYGCEL